MMATVFIILEMFVIVIIWKLVTSKRSWNIISYTFHQLHFRSRRSSVSGLKKWDWVIYLDDPFQETVIRPRLTSVRLIYQRKQACAGCPAFIVLDF